MECRPAMSNTALVVYSRTLHNEFLTSCANIQRYKSFYESLITETVASYQDYYTTSNMFSVTNGSSF